jgi:hypothetical protein
MKTYCILTLLITILALPSNVMSASASSAPSRSTSGSFSVGFTTIVNNSLTANLDFSAVPFTKNQQIKTYNLDDFIVDPSVRGSSAQGKGLLVSIYKHKVDGAVIVDVIF